MKVRTAAIIEENEKILCLQYTYSDNLVHTLPGGNLEFGESMKDSLIRELEEELMIKAEVPSEEPAFSGQIHLNGKDTLHVIFEAKIKSGIPTLNVNETSAQEVVWIRLEDLPKINLYPNVSEAILKLRAGELKDAFIGKINQKWF